MSHILLDDVTVDFPIYDGNQRSLRRTLLATGIGGTIIRRNSRHLAVRALEGITLDIRDGDRIGLIGHNGAGKSTLLKVLAGLYQPTRGRAVISGRVVPLLNLGVLLDPEMTGYENIDHAAILLEIPAARRRLLVEDVEEFTELGDFLGLPVKTYSQGMLLRLSFALMTAHEPEIMLADEVLGVGDSGFMARAAARMTEFHKRINIMVFASHAEGQIRSSCNKVLWLDHGRLHRFGPVEEVMNAYAAARETNQRALVDV